MAMSFAPKICIYPACPPWTSSSDGAAGGYVIAVDVVDAGAGEDVLILDEGTSARQIFGVDTGPVRAVVVGIVDDVHRPA